MLQAVKKLLTMNLYKVKLRLSETTGIIFVGCDSINEIESLLLGKKVNYHEVIETELIAGNLIAKQEREE